MFYLGLDKFIVDQRWVGLYDFIGRCMLNYGKVGEAVQVLKEVMHIHGQTLAEDHPDRLTSQHTLAGAYQANGQVREAARLLEEVVGIKG